MRAINRARRGTLGSATLLLVGVAIGVVITGSAFAAAISASSIRSIHIADGTIGSRDLATSSVRAPDIATNAVLAADIAAGAVRSSELATNAVTTADIAPSAVTAADLKTDAVGAAAIAAGAVGSSEIATGAVGSTDIADGGVTGADLGAITGAIVSIESQLVNNGGAPTAVDLLAASFGSGITASADLDTITMNDLGLYQVCVNAVWLANAAGEREFVLKVNGFPQLSNVTSAPGTGGAFHSMCKLIGLDPGDVITAEVFQNSGGQLSTGPGEISLVRVGIEP